MVINIAWLLDADWLSTPALTGFPLQKNFEKEFQKRIASEQEFNDQKCSDSQPEKRQTPGVERSIALLIFMAAKLEVNFYVCLGSPY